MPKPFDIVAETKKLKGEMWDFYLDTDAWRKFKPGRTKLKWVKVKFLSASHALLPTEPGLYVFMLEYDQTFFPPHGYILYVGQTGAGTSAATLKSRFAQYLQEQVKGGRPAVTNMLQNWKDDLSFYFATVKNKNRIAKLENSLIEATLPLVNRLIVNVQLKQTSQAAFR